jgi:hypothetical protein
MNRIPLALLVVLAPACRQTADAPEPVDGPASRSLAVDGAPVDAETRRLARAVEAVLAHPGLLGRLEAALTRLGAEPAPQEAAETLQALVVAAEPDANRHYQLAADVQLVIQADLVPQLHEALTALGPEPDPRVAAETIDRLLRAR